jgi:hypothetical protein
MGAGPAAKGETVIGTLVTGEAGLPLFLPLRAAARAGGAPEPPP